MGETGMFQGRGGVTWEITVPAEGTHRRELHDAQVASGDLVPVDAPAKKVSAAKKAAVPVDPEV
jgi:hypothetical protein